MLSMKLRVIPNILIVSLLFVFVSCSNDDDDPADPTLKGTAKFEITDAPIDDTNVEAALVTVTDIKVDGESISGFSGKQTIDLMAYQNGQVKSLGQAELEAGTYTDIELVLDYDTDASGNSPGCYVRTTDGTKHDLKAEANNTITIQAASFEVEEGSSVNVLLDFDLRKTIREEDTPQPDDQYDFVTTAEMNTSIRLVNKGATGRIEGKVENTFTTSDRIVVYAYKKGTYTKNNEISGQGASNIEFKNAVTSATAESDGSYTLHFLESGAYEVHFIAYEDQDNDGSLELKGELELSLVGNLGIDLNNITVDANTATSVDVSVIGIIN